MINFKVGDRVKVSNWYDPKETGIVTDVEGQLYRVEYEDEEYIHAEAANLSLAPEPTPSFKGVYVVSHGDPTGLLGVYATLNDAETAMTVWAERKNAEDEQALRNFPDARYEPQPYLASKDDQGYLLFEGESGDTLYIDLIELGAPCMWSWDRDQAVKHG